MEEGFGSKDRKGYLEWKIQYLFSGTISSRFRICVELSTSRIVGNHSDEYKKIVKFLFSLFWNFF